MPIENKSYTCQYCNASLMTYNICKEHEEWCLKEKEESKLYQSRLVKVFDNQYMFYAQSVEDVEKCIDYNGNWYKNYEYEDFKYPCLVMMFIHEEHDTYEDYTDYYVEVMEYNKYLRKLESMKGDCK